MQTPFPFTGHPPLIGARWDDGSQNARFLVAKSLGLIDFVEINFPVSPSESPSELGLPVIAHTSNNPLCSAFGVDPAVAALVRQGAHEFASPWIGEHLAWLSDGPVGSMGYVMNPPFCTEFKDVAVENTKRLMSYYGLPVALELGPVYSFSGSYESELHFLDAVAREAGSLIIFDVSHWLISNNNCGRPERFGLDALDLSRVVELHVAGIRPSDNSGYWHDAHALPPSASTLEIVSDLVKILPNLRAVTLEHNADAPPEEFISALRDLRNAATRQ